MLLHGVHSRSRARVLQVVLTRVVVVVHVGGLQVLELVVVVGSHCGRAPAVRSHHFGNIGSSGTTQSHPRVLTRLLMVVPDCEQPKGPEPALDSKPSNVRTRSDGS